MHFLLAFFFHTRSIWTLFIFSNKNFCDENKRLAITWFAVTVRHYINFVLIGIVIYCMTRMFLTRLFVSIYSICLLNSNRLHQYLLKDLALFLLLFFSRCLWCLPFWIVFYYFSLLLSIRNDFARCFLNGTSIKLNTPRVLHFTCLYLVFHKSWPVRQTEVGESLTNAKREKLFV